MKIWLKINGKTDDKTNGKIKPGGKINDKTGKYMKIKFNSDDLQLNKILKLYDLTKVVRSVLQEDNKCYPQVFLDECLYELKMSEYDRIAISKGIDVNKTNASREFCICDIAVF